MTEERHIGYRPTWAEVDLDNLAHNFTQLKHFLAPQVKMMVCVKADAYGHGITQVANRLVSCSADYLGVASIDEAVKLREAGIKLPILILGMMHHKDIEALFDYKITPNICSEEVMQALDKQATAKDQPIGVHIKVDTGMGRIGVLHKEALKFIKKIHGLKTVPIEGVFTHLACADTNKDFTLHQIKLFKRLLSQLKKENIPVPLAHLANSMGLIAYKESHFDMVRPGLAIYGLYPKEGLEIDLKPALSLKTRVLYVKRVSAGHGISYGHTYVTKKKTTIVTLPIGYGDGYPRNLSNKAPVLIRGKRFKICGNICMDQIMVDVGDFSVEIGDEAVLIGEQGGNKITTEELAGLSDTIPYEIVCGLGSRIPRVYI